jgi:hypothetical protein
VNSYKTDLSTWMLFIHPEYALTQVHGLGGCNAGWWAERRVGSRVSSCRAGWPGATVSQFLLAVGLIALAAVCIALCSCRVFRRLTQIWAVWIRVGSLQLLVAAAVNAVHIGQTALQATSSAASAEDADGTGDASTTATDEAATAVGPVTTASCSEQEQEQEEEEEHGGAREEQEKTDEIEETAPAPRALTTVSSASSACSANSEQPAVTKQPPVSPAVAGECEDGAAASDS